MYREKHKMKIRPIEEKDNTAVYQLIRAVLKSEHLDIPGTAYFDENLKQLSHFYATHQPADYFVIENEAGEIVGGAGFAPISTGICELQKLYIDQNYRKKGLSKLLMNQVLSAAKKDYQAIYLETHHDLKSALMLYERYGFEQRLAPLPESEHATMDVWMIKKLT